MKDKLQIKYDSFSNFILSNDISEEEMLFIIANYLFDKTDYYLEKDRVNDNVNEDIVIDFKNYDDIVNYQMFNKNSITFQLAILAHQLLYLNNKVITQDYEHYSK